MTLAEWMEANGLTDETLAAALKIDRSTASRFRRAKMLPSSAAIAEIFRLSDGKVEPNSFFRAPYPLPEPRGVAA
jgi:transcriptional regulator with XRE-family HTH domain